MGLNTDKNLAAFQTLQISTIPLKLQTRYVERVQLKVGVKAEPCRGSFLLAIDDGADKSLKIK